ncbi:MAG TPA: RidA family protein [Deltaproteobacteria bacterium]|nr:RidA family protein [Deltaproteobacteria bacterium]
MAEQTARAIENARCILNACGLGLENGVKTEVFLRDMDDFAGMNAAYATFFTAEPRPARTTVEVSRLPRDVLVEISCVAYRG